MWYSYLNRDQPYLRSYRTNNLWLDQYHKKLRCPRVTAFHIGVFKRMGKTFSDKSDGLLVGFHLHWIAQVRQRIQDARGR